MKREQCHERAFKDRNVMLARLEQSCKVSTTLSGPIEPIVLSGQMVGLSNGRLEKTIIKTQNSQGIFATPTPVVKYHFQVADYTSNTQCELKAPWSHHGNSQIQTIYY